jgi:hypothetical protein
MTPSQCPVNRGTARVPAPPGGGAGMRCPVVRDGAGRLIPYVTLLKGEGSVALGGLVAGPGGRGVVYRDEVPEDRDRRGALWVRNAPPSDGRSIPLFRKVHPRRAVEAMLDLRCQVCLGPPDRNRQGTLFFAEPDPSRPRRHWPDTEYTHHPPTCLPCAREALAVCSFVQRAPALRVRNPRPWGVDGLAYTVDASGTPRVRRDVDRCSYDDLRLLPWMLALQPIARLSRCTVTDLRTELTAAGLEPPEPRTPRSVAKPSVGTRPPAT